MKERPINFNDEMVRAIIDGRKTQTRRALNVDLKQLGNGDMFAFDFRGQNFRTSRRQGFSELLKVCQSGKVGDRMYVREAWQYYDWTDDGYPMIRYRADETTEWKDIPEDVCEGIHENIWAKLSEPENYKIDGAARDRKWRPSIHMPRWASRITLEITGVRVERLQGITINDLESEGVSDMLEDPDSIAGRGFSRAEHYAIAGVPMSHEPEIYGFAALWDSIYGHGSWESNPWVWVVEFKLVTS